MSDWLCDVALPWFGGIVCVAVLAGGLFLLCSVMPRETACRRDCLDAGYPYGTVAAFDDICWCSNLERSIRLRGDP